MNHLNTLLKKIETLNRLLLSFNKKSIPTPYIYPNQSNIDLKYYDTLIRQKELEINALLNNNDKILFWC